MNIIELYDKLSETKCKTQGGSYECKRINTIIRSLSKKDSIIFQELIVALSIHYLHTEESIKKSKIIKFLYFKTIDDVVKLESVDELPKKLLKIIHSLCDVVEN